MKIIILATAAVTLATAPVALAAAGGNGNGNGAGKAAAHANVNAAARVGESNAVRANGGWSVDGAGVARNPAGKVMANGLPPGQAKKMNQGLAVGSVLSTRYPGYQVITRTDRYNLPAAPTGYQYVRVGDDAYLRQSTSGSIARVIENLFR